MNNSEQTGMTAFIKPPILISTQLYQWVNRSLTLCSQISEAVVKYSVLANIERLFAAKYLPNLPTKAELEHELEQDRLKIQAQLMPGVGEI